ncbi:MAG: hypothetical protein LPL00_01325 [Alphaproteobacteria bacterium]|nr:hypothetical protein [Alphaproteobacteria bacterium]MDX5368035.1 hypothetical protein [Alphaproteobacteria bacterium]MDX5462877.1 hypothetical protein [Alphaproteobacteria bacterium]
MSTSIGGAAGAQPIVPAETGGDFALPDTGGEQVAWGFFGGGEGETIRADGDYSVSGTNGNDTVRGQAQNVFTYGGDDTVEGQFGTVETGPGDDTFVGDLNLRAPRLDMGPGNDSANIVSAEWGVNVDMGSGIDQLTMSAGDVLNARSIDGGDQGLFGRGEDTLAIEGGRAAGLQVRDVEGTREQALYDANGYQLPVYGFENIELR